MECRKGVLVPCRWERELSMVENKKVPHVKLRLIRNPCLQIVCQTFVRNCMRRLEDRAQVKFSVGLTMFQHYVNDTGFLFFSLSLKWLSHSWICLHEENHEWPCFHSGKSFPPSWWIQRGRDVPDWSFRVDLVSESHGFKSWPRRPNLYAILLLLSCQFC